jgi:hypothetical protein
VLQAYRFAVHPRPAQERALRSHAGAARFAHAGKTGPAGLQDLAASGVLVTAR